MDLAGAMKRREFVGVLGLSAFICATHGSLGAKDTINVSESSNNEIIFPPLLKSGAKVAFTAPGSPVNVWSTQQIANFFSKRGCTVVYGETITKRDVKFRYLSRDDKFRADELNKFFADESINCIVAARGGYGSIRILDMIDYQNIQKNPKVFIGFSDITTLLNAIFTKSRLVTFHGPTGNFSLDNFTTSHLESLIFDSPKNELKQYVYRFAKNDILNSGESSGRLVGGNLTNLVSLLGTDFDFDTTDSILFLEEVSEQPYKIDRMLKQLELAGKFKNCRGVILGYFGKLDTRRNFYPDYSLTLREIFEMYFKKYDFPVVMNLPFGHKSKFLTFPIGVFGKVDTEKCEFSLNLYEFISKKENM